MSERIQYVTLGVAEELFAAPVDRVQEILDIRPIARLPHAPAELLGVTDVRGEGVPVVDLRSRLGLPKAEDTADTRIVVLCLRGKGGELRLGLRTDRVLEVTLLDDDSLDPAPSMSPGWSGHCIAGLGRRNGRFVAVLDMERLLGQLGDADACSD